MTRVNESGGDSTWFWWVVGVGVVSAAIYVLALLIRDVFSVSGLAYTLGLGDGTGLLWPQATVALTWALFVECCALAGVAGNYFTGRWKHSLLANLLLGHVTFLGWVFRALWAGCRGTYRSGRWALARVRPHPAVLLQSVPADDDFEGLVVEAQAA